MSNQFEPSFKEKSPVIFNQWEYSEAPTSEEPVIDEQEVFKQTCEKLKEEAKAAGYAEGLQQAQEAISHQQMEFSKALQGLLQPMQLLNENIIQEIVKTMLWLCRACIGIELSIHPEKLVVLLQLIKDELPSLKGNKVLALNPEDLEWVSAQTVEDIFADVQNLLVSDNHLSRGDFYLKSEQVILDGQLSTRLSALFSEYISKSDWDPLPVVGEKE